MVRGFETSLVGGQHEADGGLSSSISGDEQKTKLELLVDLRLSSLGRRHAVSIVQDSQDKKISTGIIIRS